MKNVLRSGVAALTLGVLALFVGAATAGTTPQVKSSPQASSANAAFSGKYAGRAVVRATSDTAADINASGSGKSNVLGASKVTGIGKGFQGSPCSSFSGAGAIKGKQGAIKFKLAAGSKVCPSAADPNQNAITASAKVTGGTLKFKKARGTLKITGNYDRGKGTFTATFKGTIRF